MPRRVGSASARNAGWIAASDAGLTGMTDEAMDGWLAWWTPI